MDIAVIEGRKKTDEQAIDIQTLTESYPDEIITVEKNNSQPGLPRCVDSSTVRLISNRILHVSDSCLTYYCSVRDISTKQVDVSAVRF